MHIVATASVAEQSASGKRRERPNIAVTASSSAAREGQIRKSSTASSIEVASVVDRARSGNGHEKLQHRVGFDGLRFDDESGPRADAASRERRPSHKVRMQSVDLHYQTHGNDVHRASCASQSVNLRNQTPGVGFLAQFEHAECVPALSNTINIALHAHGRCRLNCTAKHKTETLNKEK